MRAINHFPMTLPPDPGVVIAPIFKVYLRLFGWYFTLDL